MGFLFPNGIKGLSDSKWSGVLGSAFRLVGIDIHSTPGLIKVRQALAKVSGSTVTELCKHKVAASNGTTLWFSAESGKIWREIAGAWSLAHTTIPSSGGALCLGAGEFKGWILWATKKYLHRIHVDDINEDWANFAYENFAEFSIGDDEFHPMMEQNLDFFIGDAQVIAKVSDNSTADPNPSDLLTTTLGSSVPWLAVNGIINPSEDAFPTPLYSARRVSSYPETGITAALRILAVGAGGGGGGSTNTNNGAGGGGAGQVVETDYAIAEGAYAVTIGAGGAANTGSGQGTDGSSTSVGSVVTAIGGGGGGGSGTAAGRTGASGGGAARGGTGGTGTAGNNGASDTDTFSAGGGGGAGTAGSGGSGGNGGAGGSGTSSSISGSAITYGGGGGAGGGIAGSGASGGSGAGNGGNVSGPGTAATANRGGGGGGAGGGADGGNGGSGVVVISYATGTLRAMGGTITTAGGKTIHTFTTDGTFTVFVPQTTFTESVAVPPGHNRVLLVIAANYTDDVPTGATFNGSAMTLVDSGSVVGTPNMSYGVFMLFNPDAITGDIVVTWPSYGASNVVLHAVVYDLCSETTPLEQFASQHNTGTDVVENLTKVDFQSRLLFVLSGTATHTQADAQTQLQAGTNSIGNDSSSYIGTTEGFGFTTETDFNIRAPERITTLEPFDVDLLVGTQYPGKNIARVLRWDTSSESWSAQDIVDENGVNAFIRDDNYVYVQAGDFGRLYFYNGEQLLPYQRIPGDWSPSQTGAVNQSAVATLLGVPVFGLSNVAGNPALQGVYAFGSYSKDYPKVLDLSFPISSGAFSGVTIGAVLVKGADLMVAWKDADGAGVDKLDYTTKYASAYIETMLLSGPQDRGILKTLMEACAYLASLPADTGITIGVKRKYEADYTTLVAVTDQKLSEVLAKNSTPDVANLQLRFGFTTSNNSAPEVENFGASFAPLQK